MEVYIDSFKKEENLVRLLTKQLIAENIIEIKRKYKDHAKRIFKIFENYKSRENIWKEITHNFLLQY